MSNRLFHNIAMCSPWKVLVENIMSYIYLLSLWCCNEAFHPFWAKGKCLVYSAIPLASIFLDLAHMQGIERHLSIQNVFHHPCYEILHPFITSLKPPVFANSSNHSHRSDPGWRSSTEIKCWSAVMKFVFTVICGGKKANRERRGRKWSFTYQKPYTLKNPFPLPSASPHHMQGSHVFAYKSK